MFKFLRSKAKIFYWVIAVSFILFIFLAWGMDFQGSQRTRDVRADALGSVNGYAISSRDWDNAYQSQLGQMRQRNPDQPLSADQAARAAEQVWNNLVRDRLVEAEIQRLGLIATDDEILDILKNDPPPALLANYKDDDGVPDLAAYLADLSNPARDWTGVENYLRVIIPRQKLQQLIVAPAVVTDAEVREAFVRQTGQAVAEYIGVIYGDLESDYEPTDEEVAAYFRDHAGLYQRPTRARLHAITWPKEPSEADHEEVLSLILEIKSEIESGLYNFVEAADIYSQDATSANGGDLGTFDRNRMGAPFTETAFSLPVGQISEPVETEFGFHLIEVLERIEENDEVVKVHARHILLKLDPGEETLLDIYTQAEEFLNSTDAALFLTDAAADSLNVISPDPVQDGQDIPGLRNSLEGVLYAHRTEPGTISPIMQNQDCYYAVLAEEIVPKGVTELEEVRSQVELKLQEEHNRQLAAAKLGPAVGSIQMGKSFADAATQYDLTYAVTDTFTASGNIPVVGYGTPFNRVALEVEVDKLVPEVQTRRGLFALRTLWKEPLDEVQFEAQKDRLRTMLLSRKQRELEETWYSDQMASADIVDNRNVRKGGAS